MGKFQLFPDQASTLAPQVDLLFFYLCAVTFFFTALIAALILVFAIKYRRKAKTNARKKPRPTSSLKLPGLLFRSSWSW